MDIHQIVSKASDDAIQKMAKEFQNKENHYDTSDELSEIYQHMMTYCNYLVESALEEYSKQSK